MKRALSILVFISTLCFITAWSDTSNYSKKAFSIQVDQKVFVQPGDTSSRYFGDLKIQLILDKSGTQVYCEMYLSTILIGVQTLTASQNKYHFDLQLGDYFAEGELLLILVDSPQVSKVSGNFEYSVEINKESFKLKGDIIAWYLTE